MSDTKYARDLAVESCRRIAEGESLRSVCMLGVFAEFERSIIQERIRAGIARARQTGTKSGKAFGRPRVSAKKEAAVRVSLAAGNGIRKTAKLEGVGNETVARIKREMAAATG